MSLTEDGTECVEDSIWNVSWMDWEAKSLNLVGICLQILEATYLHVNVKTP